MVLLLRMRALERVHPRPGGLPEPRRSARPHRRSASRCGPVQAKSDDSFELSKYHEANVTEVRLQENQGNIIILKLKDGRNSVLPVYIGEYECTALVKEINKKPAMRPSSHDLMRDMLVALGHRVCKVRISSLVGNTYYAKIHFKPASAGQGSAAAEVEVDARPSDAINLAVRFGAPIYVNKEVAKKMAEPAPALGYPGAGRGSAAAARDENANEVVRSCRDEVLKYHDPTIMHKLQLGLAIAEDRFEDASKLRDTIDRMLASDRALSLVVAIETALEDARYEEAARLRDEFRRMRLQEGARSPLPPPPPRLSDIVDL